MLLQFQVVVVGPGCCPGFAAGRLCKLQKENSVEGSFKRTASNLKGYHLGGKGGGPNKNSGFARVL